MKLIKTRAGWRRFLRNECGMSSRDVDGEREPTEYPCYAYADVRSWAYQEQKPVIMYEDDIERMLNSVRIARLEGK